MNRGLDRRLVALAAAYAVAFNTLLPGLTAILLPTPIGEIGLAVICSAGGAGSASDSGAPEKPQACAMPGCAAADLQDDDPTRVGAAGVSVGLAGLAHDGQQTQTFWRGGSKLARGPPVV
jgi:hypothetical protein